MRDLLWKKCLHNPMRKKAAFEWDKGAQRSPYEPSATLTNGCERQRGFSPSIPEPCATRRGAFEWETIAKYLIAFVILIILILLIGLFKDKLLNVLDAAKVMFGG